MERSYYEKYYSLERNHWWFVARAEIIKSQIENHIYSGKPLKILNLGIATGATSIMLSQFGEVVSSEYDAETCAFVESVVGLKVVQASITDLPFDDERFDMVCAFDVIEHVEDDHKAMEEMYRVCKTSGHVVITVPADMSLWSQHDEINHHFRRYEKREIFDLAKSNGLSILFLSYFNSLLYPGIKLTRMIKNTFFRKDTVTSDFDVSTPAFLQRILKFIFNLEVPWLKQNTFPFGVSLLLVGKKMKNKDM